MKTFLSITALLMLFGAQAWAGKMQVRNITRPMGERDNQLSGIGLVVGLNGTGDTRNSSFTQQGMINMLQNYGIVNGGNELRTRNVAVVMVEATLAPYLKEGDKIDVLVSSMGDATSLSSGTLIQVPLKAANGQVYAVAQGALSVGESLGGRVGGLIANSRGRTTARIPNGALVEGEVPATVVGQENTIRLVLRSPDYATAARMSMAINETLAGIKEDYKDSAKAKDASTVEVRIPTDLEDYPTDFIAALGQVEVEVEEKSNKVVVNERTGTVVMGMKVAIDTVAVAHGNLNVNVLQTNQVSQPAWFAPGQSALYFSNSNLNVKGGGGNLVTLPESASVADLVTALNTIGATPRDLISILQAIKEAGALHADLEIM
ncbi:MAG: flagellar basal body P-ring protein FlgI [candidate division FCPU426 bacterium]